MTRVVILAAGQGTRLRPLTDALPKTLVPLLGRSMLLRQLDVLQAVGVRDVRVVIGHAAQAFDGLPVTPVLNPDYASTNMVASLACARTAFDGGDDVVVAYGDIVYSPEVLQALLAAAGPVAVVVDTGWESLWRLRMDDPLSDAESMRLSAEGLILELGRKPQSLSQIEGQYIGLFKVSQAWAPHFFDALDDLAPDALIEGRPKAQAYMTAYLQWLIDHGLPVRAVTVRHGWLEVDSTQDLARYVAAHAEGRLDPLITLAAFED